MAKSVAIISAVYPYPADSGKKVVLSGLVDYWRERVGDASLHYVLIGPQPSNQSPVQLHCLSTPGRVEQLVNLGWWTLATRRKTIQESMLYGRRVRSALRRVLDDIHADLEIFDTVRMGQYVSGMRPAPGRRRVIYLEDLFSTRYDKMLDVLRQHSGVRLDPLGDFSAMVPGAFRRALRVTLVQRAVLRFERRLVARREDESTRQFADCLLVNDEEVAVLRSRAGSAAVHTLTPLLSEPVDRARRYEGAPEFVFLGLLSLPHNDYAIRSFLTHQMPALVRMLPAARLVVVGRGARPDLCQLAARFGDRVEMRGYVQDLSDLLGDACAMINPLLFGSGVKLKVVEALARGLPVVSTAVGAEGIASGPEQGCVIEDDVARHPELMAGLTDPARNQRLSDSARRHYQQRYAPRVVFREYDKLFTT